MTIGNIIHHNSGIVMPREEFEALTEAMTTVLRIGAHFAPILIARLDDIDGDLDGEPDGDSDDAAWVEWHTMRGSQKRGPNIAQDHEDAEDDDPDCGHDEGEPDFSKPLPGYGPGCLISDSDHEEGAL